MKRLHVHLSVEDLQHSIGFYSALFASEPTVTKRDYAKWMLDDPRVNFAISTRRASIISAPGRIAGGQRACMRRAPVFRCGASKQRGDDVGGRSQKVRVFRMLPKHAAAGSGSL